jgi:hypothetical protein
VGGLGPHSPPIVNVFRSSLQRFEGRPTVNRETSIIVQSKPTYKKNKGMHLQFRLIKFQNQLKSFLLLRMFNILRKKVSSSIKEDGLNLILCSNGYLNHMHLERIWSFLDIGSTK